MGAALLLSAAPATAHDNARSTFEARPAISAAGAGLQIVFALDAQSLRDLTGAPTGEPALAYLDARFAVTHQGAPCPREPPRSFDVVATAVVIDVVYRCAGAVTLESTLFHDEWIPHEVIGTIHHGGRVDRHFFTRGERVQIIDVQPPQVGGFRTATPPPGAFSGAARPSGGGELSGAALPAVPSEPGADRGPWRLLVLGALGGLACALIVRRAL